MSWRLILYVYEHTRQAFVPAACTLKVLLDSLAIKIMFSSVYSQTCGDRHFHTYLAHDVGVVVGDEPEAPGPTGLLVVHHHRVFDLAEPGNVKKNCESLTSRQLGASTLSYHSAIKLGQLNTGGNARHFRFDNQRVKRYVGCSDWSSRTCQKNVTSAKVCEISNTGQSQSATKNTGRHSKPGILYTSCNNFLHRERNEREAYLAK